MGSIDLILSDPHKTRAKLLGIPSYLSRSIWAAQSLAYRQMLLASETDQKHGCFCQLEQFRQILQGHHLARGYIISTKAFRMAGISLFKRKSSVKRSLLSDDVHPKHLDSF